MNQAQVDYAALRFKSAKDLSSVANDIKSGRVAVETVYVQNLGKRVMKFRCPPGTRRGGKWTDRLGTDCNLGPARAGLAKITRTVSRLDDAISDAEKRKLTGGPGLIRYQAGRAAERAGEVVDYAAGQVRQGVGRAIERTGEAVDNAAESIRKRGQATRVRLGQALESAGEAIDRGVERLNEAIEKTKERVGAALERAGDAWDERADRKYLEKLGEEAGRLLTGKEKSRAIEDLADQLHEAWRQTRKKPDGTFEPRLKDDGNGGQIDIANTRYKDLPEKWQAENLAAATHVVDAIDNNPDVSDDEIAAMVHDAWLERNGEWAPDELKVDYADLPEDEQNKDLAIVEQARANIAKQVASRKGKKSPTKKPKQDAPLPDLKNTQTLDEEFAAAIQKLREDNYKEYVEWAKRNQPWLLDPSQGSNGKPLPPVGQPSPEDITDTPDAPDTPDTPVAPVDPDGIVGWPDDVESPFTPPESELPPQAANTPEPNVPEGDAGEGPVGWPDDVESPFTPPESEMSESPDKQPIPEGDSGKVPTPERTVIKKPKDGKTPSGPSKAAGASLDDAKQKNAKKTGKKLPGKKFGSVFTKEDSAKKWGKNTAETEGITIYVAKGPDGKYRLFDEEMFNASGFEAVAAYNGFGGEVDLPSKDIYPDATPEDAIEDVKIAQEEAVQAAASETAELATPAASSKILKRSKTGKFLPNNFNSTSADVEKMNAFNKAFGEEAENVREFWWDRLGSVVDDPEEGLKAIDAYIAKEIADGANPGKVGVLNAERNNYLAMLVPNDGEVDIDIFQRIHYVGPTRREKIIEAAGLQDLVVGKSKGPKANKDLGLPAGADNVTPTYAITPDPSKNPIVQINKALNDSDTKGKAKAIVAEMTANGFKEFADEDGVLSPDAFENAKVKAWQEYDAYGGALLHKLKNDEGITQEEVDKLSDLHAQYDAMLQATPYFHDSLYQDAPDDPDFDAIEPEPDTKSILEKNNEFIEAAGEDFAVNGIAQHQFELWAEETVGSIPDFNDEDSLNAWFDAQIIKVQNSTAAAELLLNMKKKDEEVTASDVVDTYLVPALKKEWWDKAKADALAKLKAGEANKTVEMSNLALELSNDNDSAFIALLEDLGGQGSGTPYAVTTITATSDLVSMLENAYNGEIFYKGKKISYQEAKQISEQLKAGAAPEAVEAIIEQVPEVTPQPPVSHVDFGATGKVAALKSLFEATPEFDYSMITSHEGSRLGTTLDSILSRVTSKKYAEEARKFVDALPENLAELSPEEQIAAIRAAVGVSDNLSAAKFLARAAYNAQFGSKENLSQLKKILDAYGSADSPAKQALMAASNAAEIEEASERLKAAADQLAALPADIPSPVRDLYRGAVNDARTRLVNALLVEHMKSVESGDTTQMAKTGKRLAGEVAQLDESIRVGVEQKINNGISVVGGSPNSLSGKGAIEVTGFDSSLLGSVQADGSAVAYSIPIGHSGIWTQEDASEHLQTGGNLSGVPDEFLKEAIWANTGKGKRFQRIDDGTVAGGFNDQGQSEKDKTTGFIDTLTGKRYVIKTAHRNNQEHTQEIAAARLSQILGNPSTGMRFGSGLIQKPLPGPQQAVEGQQMGDQRAIVMEHVSNLFQGEGYEVLGHLHEISQLPAGSTLDGESLARMMVLDRSMNYFDRTSTNVVAVRGPDGRVHLHPIDHGNGFRPYTFGDEQEAGFMKPGKPDHNQLRLMTLAKSLSPEERERFAATLTDAVRRFKRTQFGQEFEDIANKMGVSEKERERLAKHAKYLEDKKKALDYDAMTEQVLKQLGFSQEQIDSFKVPPSAGAGEVVPGFGIPKGGLTVHNFQPRLAMMPSRGQYITMNYGGDQIEDMEVRVQRLRFKPRAGGTNAKYVEGTQMVFKRRDDYDVDLTDGTWEAIVDGHASVSGATDSINGGTTSSMTAAADGKEVATINLQKPSTAPGTKSYNGGMKTYMRTLDDGTIVLVTHGPGQFSSYGHQTITPGPDKNLLAATPHNTVRVIFPGDQKDVTPERVAAAMEAVGITQHGEPTPAQIRERGIRALYSTLYGRVPQGKTTGQLINELSAKYQITEDDFESRTTDTGKILPMLTAEAAKRLHDRPQNKTRAISHSVRSNQHVLDIILSGGVLSTLRRFDHGADKQGISSPTDMMQTGGGDLVYTSKNTNFLHNATPGTGRWYSPSVIMMRRSDYHAFNNDAFGGFANYQDFDTGFGGNPNGNETDFKGMLDMSMGIIVVSAADRTQILQAAAAAGRTHVNGVPLEDLIATPATFNQKLELLYKRWGFDWPPT